MHTVKKESKDFRFRHLSLCSKDLKTNKIFTGPFPTRFTHGHGRKDRRRSFSRTHATRKAGHPAFPRPLAIGRMFACGRSDLGSRSANLCARRLGLHRVGATQQTYPSISVPVKNTGGSRDTRDRHTESCTKSDTQTTLRTVPSYRLTDAHAQRTTTQHAPRHDTTRHTMDMNLHQLHKSGTVFFSKISHDGGAKAPTPPPRALA